MIRLSDEKKAERNKLRDDFRKAVAANNGTEKAQPESQYQIDTRRTDRGRVTSGFGAGSMDSTEMILKGHFVTEEDARNAIADLVASGEGRGYGAVLKVRRGKVFRKA